MVDIQSVTAEIRRGKKKETGQKYNVRKRRRVCATQGGHKKKKEPKAKTNIAQKKWSG